MSNMQCDPLLNGITNRCHQILATKEKVVNKQLNSNDVTCSKSDEQSSKPIHISIQSSFNCLINARKEDSSWIPAIILPITIPPYVLCMACKHLIQTPHTQIFYHFEKKQVFF